ncbi:cytochrome b [Parahaliea mediterranea]|uniref:Cytochrome b n=1 Tax=Parahaliea mediterranea TaxID=651086 RepID=A0A939DEG7_9GAMM|nr:cytochrome b [Parahaliea mediterranea]MBN7796748.1 cytochrome b [Parahaliea mediterranea]
MSHHEAPVRYGTGLMALHWLTLLLVIGAYGSIELRELFERGTSERDFMKWLHFNIGLSILLVTALRLGYRWARPAPPALATTPAWQRFSAGAVHASLYALLLAMPVLGWAVRSAEDHEVALWGLGLPSLLAPDEGLAEQLEEVHELLGKVGYGLIAFHALAALAHHYLQGDDTLRRMLPARR